MEKTFNETIKELTSSLADLLIKKNTDYGNSIFETGIDNVIVRIQDKVNRIKNIFNGEIKIQHETIKDTFFDLAGYSLIAIMMLKEEPPTKTINQSDIYEYLKSIHDMINDLIREVNDLSNDDSSYKTYTIRYE